MSTGEVGWLEDAVGRGIVVAGRTVLWAVGLGGSGRHTLGGLGQRCGELIANCD